MRFWVFNGLKGGVCKKMLNQGIGAVISERQNRIINWLREVEPELGELYEGACEMIKNRSFPGRDRFICHAVREIRNRLPNAVAEKYAVERLNYPEEVTPIAQAWKKAGLESVYKKKSDETGNEPGQYVPREVFVLVNRLIRRHGEVKNRKEENARRLLIALEPENEQLRWSLAPVVDKWIEETEWFVDRAHVGKAVNEDELVAHSETFEVVLGTFARHFYEGFEEIEQLVEKANASNEKPSDKEVMAVVMRLGRAKYRIHLFDKLKNPHWIEPLKNAGFFKDPPETKEGEAYETWLEGRYLKKVASKVPDKVLEVISEIQSRNPFVKSTCIECLLEMPEDVAIKGIKVIENMLPRGVPEGNLGWSWVGKKAAELMVKFAAKNEGESFKISWIILDAWVPQETKRFRDISGKFTDHDYRELVLKYFSKLWEVNTEKSIWVMVKILNRCLEELDKRDEYDVSRLFYAGQALRNLDSIEIRHAGVGAILVKGICEAGQLLAKNTPEKLSKLLDVFEKFNRAIFLRIEMYLLRFVGAEIEKERINRIIVDSNYIGDPCYEYEYKLLLRDKFDEVSEETRKAFIEWIKKEKITEERKKEVEEWCQKNGKPLPDFEKWENQRKGEELYLVRDKFSDLYEGYKNKSGLSDGALAPRRMVSEAHFVSPEEGSQYSSEKMGKDNVEIVVNYLLEPKNYEGKDKVSGWGSAKDALAASFKTDVKKRPMEYLNVDLKKLERLDPEFLGKLFYGVSEAVRDGSFKKDGWGRLIDLACEIVGTKKKEKEWRNCFLAILWVLRDGFGEESNRIEFNKTIIRKFWFVLKDLVSYNYDEKLESEKDPVHQRCRSVQGGAFEQVVLLGNACKKDFVTVFDNFLRKEMGEVYKFVAKEVKRSEVNCTFGLEFPRIYWLDNEWVESKLDEIFPDEMWEAVWGTYTSWGRPSQVGFELLVRKGKYEHAVELLGTPNRYEFGKNPEEGLVEHLMIGYFNEWVEFEDELLKKFFEKASAKLRGNAARFLTTGFKSVNEEGGEEKKKIAERMKKYWEKRLEVIGENPKENFEEAVEFTGWVEESLLEAKETLGLLEKTLDLSGGKFGQMRDVREFIGRICELGNGNELIALRCLKKATADENMREPWARYEERLKEFLEQIGELPNDYENVEDILNEVVEVADLYGRLQPDKFREIWEKLNKRLRESKV